MIAVDTSVWVAALRRATCGEARHLSSLLDDDQVVLPITVRLELLSGATSRDLRRLQRTLAALPVLAPTESTWTRLEQWVTRAAAGGHRFGVADLLVAALASDHDCAVWSLDSDFTRMAGLGFITLHEPPR